MHDPLRILDDHIADSLVAVELEVVRDARSLVDIGAGAGLPGLALAAVLPQTEVALVESNARKVEFIRAAIAACDLANASAVHARVESWHDGRASCDVVTARALAPLDVVAEYAAPLLRIGGTLVAWRGRRDPLSEMQAQAAAAELGLVAATPLRVTPYVGAEHRHLHLMAKVSQTPSRFPRRPGIARKRPLGALVRGLSPDDHATLGSPFQPDGRPAAAPPTRAVDVTGLTSDRVRR